jgi:hypothetical protein
LAVAQSSHLQNYEYDASSQTVTITFVNGAVYRYSGVSFDDYNRLAQSGGSGTAFWAFIRNKYPAQKLVDSQKLRTRPYEPRVP